MSEGEVTERSGGFLHVQFLRQVLFFISTDYFSYVRVVTQAPIYRPTGTSRGYFFTFSILSTCLVVCLISL